MRIYGHPWIADNSFRIGLIGSDRASIAGTSKLFEVGDSSTLTAGNDYAWYTPQMAPTYALGVSVTNNGNANFVINKIEVDWEYAGK